jgi:PAS domain S-box-containing protein
LGNARSVPDSQGNILYYEGTIIDVTERKQAEEALLMERQRFQTLVDQAPFGIAMIDGEGKFTYVNPRMGEIVGYTIDDIPDIETWFNVVFPSATERQNAKTAWLDDVRDQTAGQRRPRVRNIICKDETKRIVSFIPVKLETGGYFISCVDMTEHKKLETELQQALKMEAIGQLAGGVAHDFNNILTVISGYAGIINMRLNANDPYSNYVKQILSSSEKAATLVQSLLAFSRKQVINPKPLSLNETIARIEKFLLRLINEDVALKTILCDEDLIIMADSGHLDQVFMNLAANARDAMPQGGTITISTTVTTIGEDPGSINGQMRPGPYALIAVADTGTGMDEKTKERIFEPFFTTKAAGKGTGLGLSTVYGIIKQHNGHIEVDSKPGKGTIFSIYLPVVNKDIERKAPVPIMTAPRGKGETVLVAEDQEQVRRLMTTMLESYGYKVLQAVDGEDAVRLFMANKDVDLLVLDAVMPKKNGKQVYDKVKRVRSDTKVLFVSGYAGDVIQQKGLFEEKLNFLSKPVLPNTLLQKIRDILDG